MTKTTRPLRGKKVLLAALGIGALNLASCKNTTTTSGNLLPPPSCEEEPSQPQCQDMRAPADGGADGGAADMEPRG